MSSVVTFANDKWLNACRECLHVSATAKPTSF